MALELKQSLKMAQQLVVTPQLQQAIKLLQLTKVELTELVEKEMLENPVLEDAEITPEEPDAPQSKSEEHELAKERLSASEKPSEEVPIKDGEAKEPSDFDWENYLDTYNAAGYTYEREARLDDENPTYENFLKQTESLQDHLFWQIRLSGLSPDEMELGSEIIGNINDDGYLQATVSEIAIKRSVAESAVESVLKVVQSFDPPGVGARDLKECLILQARLLGEGSSAIVRAIQECMPELEKHDYAQMAKKLDVDLERAKIIAKIISEMEPKPGRPFGGEEPQYIVPDVYVQNLDGTYSIVLNEDGLPKLKVSDFYRRALMRGSDVGKLTKEYIQERMRAAMWLIKSIHQRQRTLYKVTESIVKFQKDFFDNGIAHLHPLVLKQVADDIGMHESTISRVTTNKFVHTPRGIFELKFFFNSGINQLEGEGVASEAVKLFIKNMIDKEDPSAPLSDREIADALKAKNVDIARRTVAKYREVLRILPSSRRKKKD